MLQEFKCHHHLTQVHNMNPMIPLRNFQLYFQLHLTLIAASTLLLVQVSIVTSETNSTSSNTISSVIINLNNLNSSSSSSSNSDASKTSSSSSGKSGQVHSRKKRGIMELAGMISCVTGCDPIKYKGYGCYCGYSGVGMPVDAIDR